MPIFTSGHEVVTSSTKPASPSVGQLIYCTDTDEYLKYVSYGGANRWMQAVLKPNRNLMINGAATVAQRATSTSFASGGGAKYYSADRFETQNYVWSAGSNPTISQDTSVYPTGFRTSMKYLVGATGLTFSSGGFQSIAQKIEGYNIAPAYSKSITLSFWVRSSLTGTYSVFFTNTEWGAVAPTRAYVAEYTISAANTWEYKTITTDMATATGSGTWSTTNTVGLCVEWGLGSHADRKGSTYTSGWSNWSAYSVQSNNQAQLASTANATFYLSGVQVEIGTAPSEYEFEPFETTLRKCQRYYQKSYEYSSLPGTNTSAGLVTGAIWGSTNTGLKAVTGFYKVPLRATVSPTIYDQIGNINKASLDLIGSATNNLAVTLYNLSENSFGAYTNTGANGSAITLHYTVTAEL
jgi:hypothetical protein